MLEGFGAAAFPLAIAAFLMIKGFYYKLQAEQMQDNPPPQENPNP